MEGINVRFNTMDELARECCTLCITRPGTLCHIVCKPSEERHLRELIFKEVMRLGDRFVWYEMRRETVIGTEWSRIRLLPIADSKNMSEKLQGLRGDVFAIEHLNKFIYCRAPILAEKVLLYVDCVGEDEDK